MCCLVLSNEKSRCRLPPAAGSPCLLIFDLVSDLGYSVVVVFVPSGSFRNLCIVAVVIFDFVDSDDSA